jgi:hypothetical protein
MKKLANILIFTGLINFPVTQMPAQINGIFDKDKCPREKITVHLSQKSCFAGEILWFKVYCSSPVFPQNEISCLCYVELVSSENTALLRKKIDLRHGEGTGEFEIPSDLTTGLYYITAYTNWMKNFGEESFFTKEIVIVNPYQPSKSTNDSLNSRMSLKEISTGIHEPGDIRVHTDKTKYSPRQKVRVTIDQGNISGKDLSGSFSVSVCRKEPVLKYYMEEHPQLQGLEHSVGRLYLPDHDGIVLSGILSDQSGNGVGNVQLVMSFPGPGTDIDSYVTGSNGEFNFLLKRGEGEDDIVITLPGSDQKISLAEPFWNGFRNPPRNTLINLDSEAVAYFRERFSCLQLQKRFNRQIFMKTGPVKDISDSSVFYLKPYQTIYPGNYITLDSVGEYFHELIPSVRLTGRRREYDIKVIDARSMEFLNEKPAVFLDGVLFDDIGAIANYPPSDIYRITVLPESYYYKDMSFGGIIDIHTKKSDFNGVKAPGNMTRFIYPKAVTSEYRYQSPDYSASSPADRTPDLRYLLTWEPYIKADSTGVAAIELYSCDVKGSFEVEVTGLTERGEIFSARCEFLVE